MNIDEYLNKFRLASRELFNNHFIEAFIANENFDFYEKFTCIEELLFSALVASRAGIKEVSYGCYPQTQILVKPTPESTCGIPIMLNREIDSGYWDHPITTADPRCTFTFMSFFDWDQKSYKDNRYVRAIVKNWPERPELSGKHALIETIYVKYSKA